LKKKEEVFLMAKFLTPDKTITLAIGDKTLTVHQKIIPDDMIAPRNVADWVRKGQPMKPREQVGPNGKPLGICVHNTNDIRVAAGTNAAEQYSRATFNGNMAGVVVHYYVWRDVIWQLLRLDERGWHAADGRTRREGRRPGQRIGGNLDTIAIEAIGPLAETTETTAVLCAWLCREFELDPTLDLWQHADFASRNCPLYIRRSGWGRFVEQVQGFAGATTVQQSPTAQQPKENTSPPVAESPQAVLFRVQAGAFRERQNAEALLARLHDSGFADAFITTTGGTL